MFLYFAAHKKTYAFNDCNFLLTKKVNISNYGCIMFKWSNLYCNLPKINSKISFLYALYIFNFRTHHKLILQKEKISKILEESNILSKCTLYLELLFEFNTDTIPCYRFRFRLSFFVQILSSSRAFLSVFFPHLYLLLLSPLYFQHYLIGREMWRLRHILLTLFWLLPLFSAFTHWCKEIGRSYRKFVFSLYGCCILLESYSGWRWGWKANKESFERCSRTI